MYKLLHKPTGLFFQPHTHRGSHLSKKGKIYQTANHGLASEFRRLEKNPDATFTVYVAKNSHAYKASKDILTYEDDRYSYGQVKAITKVSDWEVFNV